jgi:myo-inositol 2-dehydrogenase/D-chiro-inositol 1-dehydrogenase
MVMPKKNNLGVAFLGLGRMGETHLRNLSAISGVQVLVVADPDPKRAERGRAITGAELALEDPEKAINHPSVDVVIIVTPTNTHARLIEVAARNEIQLRNLSGHSLRPPRSGNKYNKK